MTSDYRRSEDEEYRHLSIREFRVTTTICVRYGEPFSQEKLLKYLEKAVHIVWDYRHGPGPGEQTVVQITVPWAAMVEVPLATSS